MMVITPIASAFSHCSSMVMFGDLSESKILVVSILADQVTASIHQDVNQEPHKQKTDMCCHTSGSCALHVCSGFGIISSTLTFNSNTSNSYPNLDYLSFYSTYFSPEIRPPILTF